MRKILMVFMSLVVFGCTKDKSETPVLSHYIPEDAAVIFKFENPNLFFSQLANNEFLKINQEHPLSDSLRQHLAFLKYFDHKTPAFLSFANTPDGNLSYTFIHQGIPTNIDLDSIKNRAVETLKAEFGEIRKYTLENQITYTSSIDSIFFVSNSQKNLEAILSIERGKRLPNHPDFEKALKASSAKGPVVLINHQKFKGVMTSIFPFAILDKFDNFSNWTALDIETSASALKFHGITTASDTLPKLINIFKDINPSSNELPHIVPRSSYAAFSFTFSNFSTLASNLSKMPGNNAREGSTEESELLNNSSEAGLIYFENASVFAIKSLDIQTAESVFSSQGSLREEFHGIRIYDYESPGEFGILEPLVTVEKPSFFLFLDKFILFSSELEQLKEVVRSFQNENTLIKSEAYVSAFQSMSTDASLLYISNNSNFKKVFSKYAPEALQAETAALDFSQHPIAALQFIYQDNFAHVHAVIEKTAASLEMNEVNQSVSIALDSDLLAPPVFFENHRTNGLDIAVQDVTNTLYLISSNGKIHWKKKLDGPILGKIQQVDLFRNGRIQLAFATAHSVEIIDREGKTVKPFPLKFRDNVTQPLAIFDYDNDRKYRFPVVQDRNVLIYDREGRSVRGFKFGKAQEEITHPPKHIRIGKNDYILITDAAGNLNILSRTGESKVTVKEKIDVSNNEWYEYNSNFINTNQQGELVSIGQNGKITKKAMNLADNHSLNATARTLVTLSDNQLSIKDKTISLDFGLYTKPQIFFVNNKIYVSVTDTQAHKVYLFDSNAELIPGFPVYGNSQVDLGNADGDGSLELTVMGDDNGVLVYEL